MTRLLSSIRKDRWFSRTWVFQERYSAQLNMYLLFQTSSEVRSHLQAFNCIGPFWEGIAISLQEIGSAPTLWLNFLKQNSIETAELDHAIRALNIAAQSVSTT